VDALLRSPHLEELNMRKDPRAKKSLMWNLASLLCHLSRAVAGTPDRFNAPDAGPLPAVARRQLIEMLKHIDAVLNRQR